MKKLALLCTTLLLIALFAVCWPAKVQAPSQPAEPSSEPKTVEEPMRFSGEGLNGTILEAIEKPAGAGNARVSVKPASKGRWVCLLVAENGRYYNLDEGQKAADFPALSKGNFLEPPPPILRTMSIFRSLAKSAMQYDATRGDRIMVLLCPKSEWAEVQLAWPTDGRLQ